MTQHLDTQPPRNDRRGFLAQLAPLAAGALAVSHVGSGQASVEAPPDHEPVGELLIAARRAMACRFAVKFPAALGAGGVQQAALALNLVDAVEDRLTIYRSNSEVSRVNRYAARLPVLLSPPLAALLARSREMWRATKGAFDPAAGALVGLWKTHLARGMPPPAELLDETRANSGMEHVVLRDRCVRFDRPRVALDFGGNGKGYALDLLADDLARRGMRDVLLHGGHSSHRALGAPPWDSGWVLDVRHPLEPQRCLARLRLRDCAMATSANVEQGVELGGRRYGHLIDPRSGQPLQDRAGVTVVAPTAEEADALSTAFFALGNEEIKAYCALHSRVGALVLPAASTGNTHSPLRFGAIEDYLFEVTA